jgi:hypothetical protein
MKSINTLVSDIYSLVQRKDGWFTEELAKELSHDITRRLQAQLGQSEKTPTLRLSKMGPTCPKALWHSIHTPGEAESLPPWAIIKYSYGHVIEALVIALAKAAGHLVTGEQDALEVNGVLGHRDCVIDGCIVDVKSMSSIGIDRLKSKDIVESDSFGYLDQLDGYLVGSADDPLVLDKEHGYILGVDKQLGHVVCYEHTKREDRINQRIDEAKRIIARSTPPVCKCETKPQGRSGNIQLGVRASYSPYKFCCWPNLRTFLYASGPIYLTHVERLPDVPEITRDGRLISH